MKKYFALDRLWCVCLLAMVCCFLWGSAFPCIKIGYDWMAIGSEDAVSQIFFAGIRFTLAGVMVVASASLGQFFRSNGQAKDPQADWGHFRRKPSSSFYIWPAYQQSHTPSWYVRASTS